jgi:hypothetical protein
LCLHGLSLKTISEQSGFPISAIQKHTQSQKCEIPLFGGEMPKIIATYNKNEMLPQ